jgi:hypothetical protein
MDDFGVLNPQRSQNGSGMSKKAQAKKFMSELSRIAEETYAITTDPSPPFFKT